MKKKIVSILALIIAGLSISFSPMYKIGVAGFVGSPDESNCTDCHGGIPNSGKGSLNISSPTLTDWKYKPGQTYEINVTVAQPGITLFGFALEALTDAGTDAGTLESIDNTQTHLDSSDVSGTMRKNMIHSFNAGKTNDSHTFTFKWKAPSKDIGPITFYSAGNAANANNLKTGDAIYTTSQVVNPSSVGISNEQATNLTVQLFPNPTEDKLTIDAEVNDRMIVSIFDLHGKLLLRKENVFSKSFMDVSDLSAGTYFTKIETTSGVTFRKFVKK
jgi:hypothetical protein